MLPKRKKSFRQRTSRVNRLITTHEKILGNFAPLTARAAKSRKELQDLYRGKAKLVKRLKFQSTKKVNQFSTSSEKKL